MLMDISYFAMAAMLSNSALRDKKIAAGLRELEAQGVVGHCISDTSVSSFFKELALLNELNLDELSCLEVAELIKKRIKSGGYKKAVLQSSFIIEKTFGKEKSSLRENSVRGLFAGSGDYKIKATECVVGDEIVFEEIIDHAGLCHVANTTVLLKGVITKDYYVGKKNKHIFEIKTTFGTKVRMTARELFVYRGIFRKAWKNEGERDAALTVARNFRKENDYSNW